MTETTTPSRTNLQSLADLAERWKEAKLAEVHARDTRYAIEHLILDHPNVEAPTEGTCRVGPFVIRTGFNRRWDSRQLSKLRATLPDDLFPFRLEWKEELKKSRELQADAPEAWKQLERALTLTDKKANITLAEN